MWPLRRRRSSTLRDLEGRKSRVVRAERDVFQIEENSHRGLGVAGAPSLQRIYARLVCDSIR